MTPLHAGEAALPHPERAELEFDGLDEALSVMNPHTADPDMIWTFALCEGGELIALGPIGYAPETWGLESAPSLDSAESR